MLLPVEALDVVLSRWSGRPHGLRVDPLGVECFGAEAEQRRGLWGRRRQAQTPPPYIHVLVHQDLTAQRIRSWAAGQLARLAAVAEKADAEGAELDRLADAESARLQALQWTPSVVIVDAAAHPAQLLESAPDRWAAYLEVGDDKVAVVVRGLTPEELALRTASTAEVQALTRDALRV